MKNLIRGLIICLLMVSCWAVGRNPVYGASRNIAASNIAKSVGQAEPTPIVATTTSPKKTNKLVLGGAVAVMAGLAIGGAFFTKHWLHHKTIKPPKLPSSPDTPPTIK